MAQELGESQGSFAGLSHERDFTLSSNYMLLKALIDRIVGSLLLVLSIPALAVLMILIRMDSPGPVIFRQQRVGMGGRPFTIFKLRSMAANAPAYSYKVPIGDRRITRVGRWLRRTGLDELPQLWNVVTGDMSLIGPRPELPFIVEQYSAGDGRRHSLRPGITGWWQIHHRNEVPMHLNLEYDFYYLDNVSFALDLQIARRTLKIMLAGARRKRAPARIVEEEKVATI